MSETTSRPGLPLLQPSQAQKHVTHNEAPKDLDVLAQMSVVAFDAKTPPALPDERQFYALGAQPTGAWAGQAAAGSFACDDAGCDDAGCDWLASDVVRDESGTLHLAVIVPHGPMRWMKRFRSDHNGGVRNAGRLSPFLQAA